MASSARLFLVLLPIFSSDLLMVDTKAGNRNIDVQRTNRFLRIQNPTRKENSQYSASLVVNDHLGRYYQSYFDEHELEQKDLEQHLKFRRNSPETSTANIAESTPIMKNNEEAAGGGSGDNQGGASGGASGFGSNIIIGGVIAAILIIFAIIFGATSLRCRKEKENTQKTTKEESYKDKQSLGSSAPSASRTTNGGRPGGLIHKTKGLAFSSQSLHKETRV